VSHSLGSQREILSTRGTKTALTTDARTVWKSSHLVVTCMLDNGSYSSSVRTANIDSPSTAQSFTSTSCCGSELHFEINLTGSLGSLIDSSLRISQYARGNRSSGWGDERGCACRNLVPSKVARLGPQIPTPTSTYILAPRPLYPAVGPLLISVLCPSTSFRLTSLSISAIFCAFLIEESGIPPSVGRGG
jgi:hypothetical protein